MIDREHNLSIARQAEALKISRGSVYYSPRPVPDADLAIMRHLDRLHLEFPFAGSRRAASRSPRSRSRRGQVSYFSCPSFLLRWGFSPWQLDARAGLLRSVIDLDLEHRKLKRALVANAISQLRHHVFWWRDFICLVFMSIHQRQ